MKLIILVCLVPIFGLCAMTAGSPMTSIMDSEEMGNNPADFPMTSIMDSEKMEDNKGDADAMQTKLESFIKAEIAKAMVNVDTMDEANIEQMGSDDGDAAVTSQEEEEMAVEQPLGPYRHIPASAIYVTASVNYLWDVNPYYQVFRCVRPCKGKWIHAPGVTLKQIDANDYEVWGVNKHDQIFKRPVDGSGEWQKVPGCLKHVSASGNGYIWGVSPADHIFKCQKPCNGQWQAVDGRLKQIDGGQSYVYGVDSANHVFVRPVDGSGKWRKIPGHCLKQVSASADNSIYGVDNENKIYSCLKPCFDGRYQLVDGLLSQVDGTFNAFAGVTSGQALFIRSIVTP